MPQEIFSFKWKYFHPNIVSSLNEGFKDIDSADVTLVSDDQIPFLAHRFVLGASSSVLKDLLLDNPSSHPLIYLRGVKQQELSSILQLMYFGEAKLNPKRIDQFLNNARDLVMKQLVDTHRSKNRKEKDINAAETLSNFENPWNLSLYTLNPKYKNISFGSVS